MASNYPKCIVYRGHETFLTSDLKEFFPTVFIGLRTSKKMITEFNIPKDDYFVVKKNDDDSYEESTLTYKRSKVLIKTSWFDDFMADLPQKIRDAPRVAPPLLELTENDKFVDDEGNVFEVEIRGERNEDEVRFKGRDVARVFEMENLVNNVQNEHTNYIKNDDYEILFVVNDTSYYFDERVDRRTKLYFTYAGLIKVINCSRSGVAYKFRDWMNRIVFKAHMGTDSDKVELAYELIDTTDDHVQLIKELQEKLTLKDQQLQQQAQDLQQQLQQKDDHILLLNELLIDSTEMEATQVIYIATSNSYANQNRFKIGGVESTEKLQPRLSTYNSRSANGDDFYYSDVFLVPNYRQIEERLKSLMIRFRDRASKEIYILHYTNIQHIVEYFCKHYYTHLGFGRGPAYEAEFINNLSRSCASAAISNAVSALSWASSM